MLLYFFQTKLPQWVLETKKLLRYSDFLIHIPLHHHTLLLLVAKSISLKELYAITNLHFPAIDWWLVLQTQHLLLHLYLLASASPRAWSLEQVLESRCWIRTGQNMTGNAFCRWPLFNRGMWYVKDREFCGNWKSYSCLKQVALSPSLVVLCCGKLSSSLMFLICPSVCAYPLKVTFLILDLPIPCPIDTPPKAVNM